MTNPRRKTPRTLADLTPAPYNPRTITKPARLALDECLRVFGDLAGFVWNRGTGHLTCANQRRTILAGVETSLIEWGKPYTVVLGYQGARFRSRERLGWFTIPGGARFWVRDVDWPDVFEKAANVAANNPEMQGRFTDGLAPLLAEVVEGRPEDAEDVGVQPLLEALARSRRETPHRQAKIRRVEGIRDDRAKAYRWAETVVVDFSGGRDSSAVLLWVRKNLPKAKLIGLYADEGVEFPGYSNHVCRVAERLGAELHILPTATPFVVKLREKGWPIWAGPWCQDLLHGVIDLWVREHTDPKTTLRMTGTRANQKKDTSRRGRTDPLAATPDWRFLAPVYEWDDESIFGALRRHKVPIWEGYGRGLLRTCCWACPGQPARFYAVLRRSYPALFRAWQELEADCPVAFWHPRCDKHKTVAAVADLGDADLEKAAELAARAAAKAKKRGPASKGRAAKGKTRGRRRKSTSRTG